MKKTFTKITLALCALGGVAAMFILPSCRRTPADLTLYGVWEEKGYTVYDTNMASFSQHRLVLDCPGLVTDSLGNPSKAGDFEFYIMSVHKKSLSSPLNDIDSITEYVKGRYRIDESHSLLDLDGVYYTDSTFSTEADLENTDFSFGAFRRNVTYKVNDKFLILMFNDSLASDSNRPVDLNHFYQVESRNCY